MNTVQKTMTIYKKDDLSSYQNSVRLQLERKTLEEDIIFTQVLQ